MNIHLDYRDSNERHTRVAFFIDRVYCGELTMLTRDVTSFQMIVANGITPSMDTFYSTGVVMAEQRISPAPKYVPRGKI